VPTAVSWLGLLSFRHVVPNAVDVTAGDFQLCDNFTRGHAIIIPGAVAVVLSAVETAPSLSTNPVISDRATPRSMASPCLVIVLPPQPQLPPVCAVRPGSASKKIWRSCSGISTCRPSFLYGSCPRAIRLQIALGVEPASCAVSSTVKYLVIFGTSPVSKCLYKTYNRV